MTKWIVISGHGLCESDNTFVIPAGKTIKFFSRHGRPTKVNEKIDNGAAKGELTFDDLVVQTLGPGERCYDYTLSAPKGVNPVGKGNAKLHYLYKIQNGKDYRFSDILTVKAVRQCEVIYFYACRSESKALKAAQVARKAEEDMTDLELMFSDRLAWTTSRLDELK